MKPLLVQIILLGISTYVQATIKCTTPDGVAGRCLHLGACKPLKDLHNKPIIYQTVRDNLLLTYSDCSESENRHTKNKVCCPYLPPQLVPVNPVLCYASDGQFGLCTNIQSCPALNATLEQMTTTRSLETLDMSRCGTLERYSVCCAVYQQNGYEAISFNSHMKEAQYTSYTECTLSTSPPDPESHCCGTQSSSGDRIVGGTETAIDEYPWLVLIEYKMMETNEIELGCGGSLISGSYVLTAGHCLIGRGIAGRIPENVRLGEYNLLNPGPDCVSTPGGGEDCTEGPLVIPIEEIIVHENYDPDDVNAHNDIALIRLRTTAPYSDFIRPICLPTIDLSKNERKGLRLFASGWGMTGTLKSLSSVKREVDLPYRQFEECQEIYKEINITLSHSHLCAGGEPGKDACKGDSGGPLMYRSAELYQIAAVVSFGPNPCGQGVPSVYTNVYSYLPWILENITRDKESQL